MRLPALILCLFFLLCLEAAAQPKPEATPPPKPVVFVSFARQSIRENDSVQVQVWLANESGQDLSEVMLHVAAPPFINWHAGTCGEDVPAGAEGRAGQPLRLGPVRAHAVLSRTLCLRSGSDIVVGDSNLLFTFEYVWQRQDLKQSSFVGVEKTLKASLLGSDNIAGIPVSLAGFIVPGLFFWLVVALFRIPWLPWKPGELALGDRLIYSVLVSLAVVVVGSWFGSTDISTGLGLAKLGFLALAGGLLGAIVGVLDWLVRYLSGQRRKRLEEAAEAERRRLEAAAEARRIKLDDGQDALLDKLLDDRPNARRPQAIVTLEDGRTFRGTLARKDASATALLGWFQVVLDGQPEEFAARFRELARERKWREALALADGRGLEVQVRDTIYENVGGVEEPIEDAHKTWENEEVRSVTNEDDAGPDELITPQ